MTTLEEELADELARLPKPAAIAPVWYTAGAPGSDIPSEFVGANGRVVPLAQAYLQFHTLEGRLTAAPYTNRETYLAKSYVWAGTWADYDAWSVAAARSHKWHGMGPSWPGQSG
jgi:hypothetical protein